MQSIDLYLVDAFTNKVFGGNVAAVCPLDKWLPDSVLQSITDEHNQSETAFFVPQIDGFELRWFTTSQGEINLCGHATLASAHVIFHHLKYPKDKINFNTRFVGPLSVSCNGDWMTLDFPSWMPEAVKSVPEPALKGLGGASIKEVWLKRDYLFLLDNEDAVRNVNPNYSLLAQLGHRTCITAPGNDCDFVSRFFCPGDALQEDPVTGSAHSMLIPFWAQRLNKTKMLARQLSKRGGELKCEFLGERVLMSGQAQTYMQGKIALHTG
jgi:predicted PhzF superfamily epimerase YddE/YHI9